MRIAVLLLITAGLSWYSHQGANNPFALKNELVIKGKYSSYLLRYTRGNRKHRITSLIIPVPLNDSSLIDGDDKEWDLITLGNVKITPEMFSTAPQTWTVMKSSPALERTETKNGWPQPHTGNQANSKGQIIARTVSPFSDETKALLLELGTQSALVCDSAIFLYDENNRTPFHEKVDLLVIPPASQETIQTVRTCFRPRFLAVIPPCPLQDTTQNIICSQDSNWSYRFKFSARDRLVPEK